MRATVDRKLRRVADHPRASALALGALLLGGTVLRLLVARQDLFGDELATYWVVTTRGPRGVLETVQTTAEITPPLSFLLSWLTTRIGSSSELVRLPAIIGGIASIPLVYAVGARTVGRGPALLAAALTTVSPFMILYSAEARGYGVLMVLLLASTLFLLWAVEDDGRWRWWVAYGACVCLSAYTHYTAVFVLAGQLAWALWFHPRARRPALVATAVAAVLYMPWLPSLKDDVESPTTDILSAFSPLSVDQVQLTLTHWSFGFPYGNPKATLRDLPGLVPMLMLAASVLAGIHGAVTRRSELSAARAGRDPGIVLVTVLALATPVGTFLQSVIGANVFSVRSLAASWPYLALAVAALIAASRPALRAVAAGMATVALAVGGITMLTPDFERPDFDQLVRLADDHPGSVVIDGASFTPGPLSSLDVAETKPHGPVFRLTIPEQRETPFSIADVLPDPADVVRRAVDAADGGPIVILANIPASPTVDEAIALLPPEYRETGSVEIGGLIEGRAVLYERTG